LRFAVDPLPSFQGRAAGLSCDVTTCCEILPRILHSPRPQNDLSVIQSVDGNNQEAFEPFALLCDLNSDTAHCADLCSMNCANQLGSCWWVWPRIDVILIIYEILTHSQATSAMTRPLQKAMKIA
jgi:hypothetical protein